MLFQWSESKESRLLLPPSLDPLLLDTITRVKMLLINLPRGNKASQVSLYFYIFLLFLFHSQHFPFSFLTLLLLDSSPSSLSHSFQRIFISTSMIASSLDAHSSEPMNKVLAPLSTNTVISLNQWFTSHIIFYVIYSP